VNSRFVKLDDLIKALDDKSKVESENYVIRYCLCDLDIGMGNGAHGVADPRLILCYLENLERLRKSVTGPLRWERAPTSRVPVYLLNVDDLPEGSPFASIDHAGRPFIVLPCRSGERLRS